MRLLVALVALFYSSLSFAQQASAPDLPGALRVQLGFNFLLDHPDSMSTGFWGSKSLNAHYLYSITLGESAFSLHPGFGIGTDKFSFDNNVTLVRNVDGDVSTEPLETIEFGEVKKTKLAATYFEVPVELRFHFNKNNFRKSGKITIGGKFGILMSSHTKVKYDHLGEKQKLKIKDNYNLNRFRYGIQGSLGIAGIAAYFYYGLNDLFEKGKGPEGTATSQVQAGIAISIF
ncbi:MAG: hypothetical protein DHS20C17_28240 [Cyclobacteriaceae bacterium]|nr:MAG: hypothetical protein DHS20C17_28240 [Cyclobacteriaceae bacterium]